jgi:hypothetical protein
MSYLQSFLVFICFLSILNVDVFSQTLTESQKIEDFEYLYNTLKENYPYFNVLKRTSNKDWLVKHDVFLNAIKEAKNDTLFLATLNAILKTLENGHTDLWPSANPDEFLKTYENDASRKRWYEEISKGSKYWQNFFKQKKLDKLISENDVNKTITTENVTLTIIEKNNIALIKINSFDFLLLENDKQKILKYLKKINNYNNLIIDIQDNGGGSSNYWKSCIIPALIDKPIITKQYLAFRNGNLINDYFNTLKFEKSEFESVINLSNCPPELNSTDFFIFQGKDTILPISNNHFKGKIYLLINEVVFSATDGFANFCKESKFATVVGETTRGDGIGMDPIIVCLPNSKVLVRFPFEMGLNSDGSSNFETKTIPDIEIKAENVEERLKKLLYLINPNLVFNLK